MGFKLFVLMVVAMMVLITTIAINGTINSGKDRVRKCSVIEYGCIEKRQIDDDHRRK